MRQGVNKVFNGTAADAAREAAAEATSLRKMAVKLKENAAAEKKMAARKAAQARVYTYQAHYGSHLQGDV